MELAAVLLVKSHVYMRGTVEPTQCKSEDSNYSFGANEEKRPNEGQVFGSGVSKLVIFNSLNWLMDETLTATTVLDVTLTGSDALEREWEPFQKTTAPRELTIWVSYGTNLKCRHRLAQ